MQEPTYYYNPCRYPPRRDTKPLRFASTDLQNTPTPSNLQAPTCRRIPRYLQAPTCKRHQSHRIYNIICFVAVIISLFPHQHDFSHTKLLRSSFSSHFKTRSLQEFLLALIIQTPQYFILFLYSLLQQLYAHSWITSKHIEDYITQLFSLYMHILSHQTLPVHAPH